MYETPLWYKRIGFFDSTWAKVSSKTPKPLEEIWITATQQNPNEDAARIVSITPVQSGDRTLTVAGGLEVILLYEFLSWKVSSTALPAITCS